VVSPFFFNYGRHPRKGLEPRIKTQTESAETFASRMRELARDAVAALTHAAADMKKYYDEHRREVLDYQPGDLVYLEGTNLRSDRPTKKLDDRRFGPRSWKRIHPVFHTVLLRPYHPPVSSLQQKPSPPPPIDIGGTPEYVVEEVLASRQRRGKTEYLVKWKGQEAFKRFLDRHGADARKLEERNRNELDFTIGHQAVYDWKRRGFKLLTQEGKKDIHWPQIVGEDTDLERGVMS